jgi:hypothetical protein
MAESGVSPDASAKERAESAQSAIFLVVVWALLLMLDGYFYATRA